MNSNYQAPLKFSQNFIRDSKLVERIVDLSSISKNDTVIEIGPGKGIITKVLASKAKMVIAIEKAADLFDECHKIFIDVPNVEVVHKDFLEYRIPFDLKYKVFSNIPFSITSEITKKLFFTANPPSETYLILQREVAEKFLGNPKETQSSLTVKPFFDLKLIYNFQKSDFSPMPSVDISLLEFKKREKPFIDSKYQKLYREFITFSFNQWKEDVRGSLRKLFSNLQLKILSENLGFSLDSKPSDLNFDQWIGLFYYFIDHVPEYKQRFVKGSEEKLSQNQLKMRKSNLTQVKRYSINN